MSEYDNLVNYIKSKFLRAPASPPHIPRAIPGSCYAGLVTASGSLVRDTDEVICRFLSPYPTVILAGTESGYPNVNPLFLTHKSRNSIFSIP